MLFLDKFFLFSPKLFYVRFKLKREVSSLNDNDK